MNTTVTLLNEWAEYEASHPGCVIEDFCRYYLVKQQQSQLRGPVVGGAIPPVTDGFLLKLIGRIDKLNMNYASIALEGTGLNQVEELGILVTLLQQKNPRKTDVINNNLFKLTSGTSMMDRLKRRGLIKECNDAEDRRAKRIELTPAGTEAIEKAKMRMVKVSKMMVKGLTEDDKQLCIALLKNIEIKYSALWLAHKGKSFDIIYKEVME